MPKTYLVKKSFEDTSSLDRQRSWNADRSFQYYYIHIITKSLTVSAVSSSINASLNAS